MGNKRHNLVCTKTSLNMCNNLSYKKPLQSFLVIDVVKAGLLRTLFYRNGLAGGSGRKVNCREVNGL